MLNMLHALDLSLPRTNTCIYWMYIECTSTSRKSFQNDILDELSFHCSSWIYLIPPFHDFSKELSTSQGLLLVPFGMSSFHETSLLFLDHFWLRCWSQLLQPRIGTGVLSSSALATVKESVAAFCKAAVEVTSLGISWNSQRDPMVE